MYTFMNRAEAAGKCANDAKGGTFRNVCVCVSDIISSRLAGLLEMFHCNSAFLH